MQEILSVKNVYKSYKKHQVLKGVSFDIHKGDVVALIGINGSGKSTLLETICGVQKQDSGEIIGIENYKYLGYVPQMFRLFLDLTVRDNLEYFSLLFRVDSKRVEEVLQMCYLKEKEKTLCAKLSGGYKQLVSLAVAILHKPQLLILDEPTSAMDPLFRNEFWKIIKKYLAEGGSVLVTTHYMEEINFCNKIMVLSSGKIVFKNDVQDDLGAHKFKSAMELLVFFEQGDKHV